MQLTINGKEEKIDQEKINIIDLLKHAEVADPSLVAVELNGKVVKRTKYKETFLNENDNINFLYFMGGGGGS